MAGAPVETIPARDARPARGSRGRAQEVDLHVAARLRERRLVLGLTQQQVAERVGGSTQQVHKYETGVNRLSAGRLHQFAEALEVEVGDLFAGLEPTAAGVATAPAAGERQRALLTLARDFVRLPGRGHQEALCALARALAGTRVE
jgi:transcriptional regulator with XRE-family HTH domain